MELESKDKLTCQFCGIEYSSVSARNKHLRNFHPDSVMKKRLKHVICSLCTNKFSLHTELIQHLTNTHNIPIKESILYFRNVEELKLWELQKNVHAHYVVRSKYKLKNGDEKITYVCNRSDYRGFVSTCKKRKMKAGGTIHIHGMCPSRIIVKISSNVMVAFVETHVGHGDLKRKRLSSIEQKCIVKKLAEGVPKDILHIDKSAAKKLHYLDDVNTFIRKKSSKQSETSLSLEQEREIIANETYHFVKSLDKDSFKEFKDVFRSFKNNLDCHKMVKKEK